MRGNCGNGNNRGVRRRRQFFPDSAGERRRRGRLSARRRGLSRQEWHLSVGRNRTENHDRSGGDVYPQRVGQRHGEIPGSRAGHCRKHRGRGHRPDGPEWLCHVSPCRKRRFCQPHVEPSQGENGSYSGHDHGPGNDPASEPAQRSQSPPVRHSRTRYCRSHLRRD